MGLPLISPSLAQLKSGADGELSPWHRFRSLLALEKGDIGVVVAYAIGIGLLSLAVPVATQALVNTVGFTALLQPVVVLTILVFLGLVGAGVLRTLQSSVIEVLQQRLFVRAAHDLASRLPAADTKVISGRKGAIMVNRFFDVTIVQKTLASLLLEALSVVLQGAVGLVLLAFYHPWLLAFDALLLGFILFVIFGLGRKGPETAIYESKKKHELVAWLEDVAENPSVFKVPGAERFAFIETDRLARLYVEARRKHFKILFRQIVMSHGLQAISVASLLGLGGALVVSGQLSIGQLVAAELVVGSVVTGLAKFGKHLESYYDLVASLDKMGTLVDLPLERDNGIERDANNPHAATLQLERVSLSFEESGTVLSDVTFEVDATHPVAVLGRNASGKSALADLVYGMHAPTSGQILLDGIDVRSLALTTLRREIAVVRRADLVRGSIYDNIALGRRGVTPQEVLAALAVVGLDREVTSWSKGLETPIGLGGVRLSRSRAALIGLARALAGRPHLLVVDELFDILDTETLDALLARIAKNDRKFSLLVMTSNEAVAARFTRVVHLDGGRDTREVRA